MAEAGIELKLFGEFRLVVDGDVRNVGLAAARQLLALLAIREERSISRSEVVALIWPGENEEASRPRLRTTLAVLRTALKPYEVVGGDKSTLTYERTSVKLDLEEAKRFHHLSQLLPTEIEESEALEQFLKIVERPFLPEFEEGWAHQQRQEYTHKSREAKLRIIELAHFVDGWERGQFWAENLVQQNAYDEKAWLAYFKLAQAVNHLEQVSLDFPEVLRKLGKKSRNEFSREFLDEIEVMKSEVKSQSSIGPKLTAISGRVLDRLIEQEPTAALPFLGSQAFREEVFAAPGLAGELCERVLARTDGYDEYRQSCMVNALVAANVLRRYERLLHWSPLLLEHATDLRRRRGSASVLANAQFDLGMYDEAFLTLEMSLEFARQLGQPTGIVIAEAQLGVFFSRLKQWERAMPILISASLELLKYEDWQSQDARATVHLELGCCYLYQEDVQSSFPHLTQALNIALHAQLKQQIVISNCLLGILKLMDGATESGVQYLAKATASAYRWLDEFDLVEILDWSSLGLSLLGHDSEALSVLAITQKFYDDQLRKIYPANCYPGELVRQRTINAVPNSDWAQLKNPKAAAAAIARLCASTAAAS